MKDKDKTHGQLIKEVTQLRRRIAELKTAEAEKSMKEAQYRGIFESSKDTLLIFDLNGVIREVNPAACAMYGYSHEEMIGLTGKDIVHPGYQHLFKEFVEKARAGDLFAAESVDIRKDGSFFDIEVRGSGFKYMGRPHLLAVVRDITERKRAEESLRTERDKAQQYLDIAEVILVALNKKGEITLINRKGNHILDYKEGELLGKNWFTTCVPSRLRKKIKTGFQKLMTGERQLTEFYENPVLTKSGAEKMIAWHNAPLKDTQGKPIGTLSSGEDITDRKRAEEALKESEKKYRQVVENATDIIYTTDINGNFTYANSIALKVTGYSLEELQRFNYLDLVVPEYRDQLKEIYGNQFRGRQETTYVEFPFSNKFGEVMWFGQNASLMFEGRKIIGFQVIARDFTERRQAEEKLRESEERYKTLFDESVVGICLADAETGIIIDCNEAMAALVGRKRTGLIGKSQKILHPTQDDKELFLPTFKQHLADKVGQILETQAITKAGEIRAVEIKANLLDLHGRKVLQALFYDITDRKQAEEALRESETRFRTLFEAIPDTVLVHDDKGTILHINEIGAQRLEWSAKELIGKNLREIVTSENAASITDYVRETHKIGWSRFETTYVSRSGWRIMAEVYEHPIVFGKKKAILSVARDITERKQTEEKLRASEEKHRDLVENINDIIYAVDEHGIVTYIAPTIESISGYTTSEIIGRPFFDFVYEEDVPYMKDALQQDISGQAEPHECRTKTKAGEFRWVRTFGRPFFEGDRLVGLRGVLTDITERKQAEEALLSEKIFSDTIMDSSPGLFFVFDDQGNILRWNQNAEKFTEYSAQEISKMNVLDFVVQEDKKGAAEAMQEVLNKGQASTEITVLSKSGKKIPFYLTGLRTHIENVTCVVSSGFDITDIKRAEEALQRSYDQLQKTFISAINALASTVEMKDQYTAGHQPRVTQLACAIAEEMGLSKDQIEGIRMAGLIHDIGKIVVPAEILNKPGPLTEVQYEMIKMHPQAGHDILKRIAFPWPVAQIVQQHHEMMDGSGYPQGLAGEDILPEARIMAVANVVEAMTAHRPYRPAYDIEEALAEISHHRGTKYDAAVVDACLRLFTERGFVFDSAQ